MEIEHKFNFFQKADKCLSEWIEKSAMRISLEQSSVLIKEGETNENIYILRSGELQVHGSTKDGEMILISQLVNEGALVGEMSFLECRLPVATVTAQAGSEVLIMNKNELNNAISLDLQLGRAFYHLMAKKLSQQIQGQNTMIHSSPTNLNEPLRKILTLFADLEESDVAWFSTNGKLYRFKPGEQLIKQDTLLPDVFLVLAGEANVSIIKDGNIKIVGKSTRGEMLGEMSMINSDDNNATANVKTTDGMEVIAIHKTVLQGHITSDLEFGMRFYRGMARMLSQRSRDQLTSMGMAYISGKNELQNDQNNGDIDDEIDFEMMSSITTAGIRFDWLCKQFQNRIAVKARGQI